MEEIHLIESDIEKKKHRSDPFGEKYLNVALSSFEGDDVRSALTNLSVRSEIISQMQRKLLKNVERASKKLKSNMKEVKSENSKKSSFIDDGERKGKTDDTTTTSCFETYERLLEGHHIFDSNDFFELHSKDSSENRLLPNLGKEYFIKDEILFLLNPTDENFRVQFDQIPSNDTHIAEKKKKEKYDPGLLEEVRLFLPPISEEDFQLILSSESLQGERDSTNAEDLMRDESEDEDIEEEEEIGGGGGDDAGEKETFEQDNETAFDDGGDEIGFDSDSESDIENEEKGEVQKVVSVVEEMDNMRNLSLQQKEEAMKLRELNLGEESNVEESDNEEEEDEEEDNKSKEKKKKEIFNPQLFDIDITIDFWEQQENKNKKKKKKKKVRVKDRKLTLKNRFEDNMLVNNRKVKKNSSKRSIKIVMEDENSCELLLSFNDRISKTKPHTLKFENSLCWKDLKLNNLKNRIEDFFGVRSERVFQGTVYETIQDKNSDSESESDKEDVRMRDEDEMSDEIGMGGDIGEGDSPPTEKLENEEKEKKEEEEEEDVIIDKEKNETVVEKEEENGDSNVVIEQRKKRRKMIQSFFQDSRNMAKAKFSISRISRIIQKRIREKKTYNYEKDFESVLHKKRGIHKHRIFMGLLHTAHNMNSSKENSFVELKKIDNEIIVKSF